MHETTRRPLKASKAWGRAARRRAADSRELALWRARGAEALHLLDVEQSNARRTADALRDDHEAAHGLVAELRGSVLPDDGPLELALLGLRDELLEERREAGTARSVLLEALHGPVDPTKTLLLDPLGKVATDAATRIDELTEAADREEASAERVRQFRMRVGRLEAAAEGLRLQVARLEDGEKAAAAVLWHQVLGHPLLDEPVKLSPELEAAIGQSVALAPAYAPPPAPASVLAVEVADLVRQLREDIARLHFEYNNLKALEAARTEDLHQTNRLARDLRARADQLAEDLRAALRERDDARAAVDATLLRDLEVERDRLIAELRARPRDELVALLDSARIVVDRTYVDGRLRPVHPDGLVFEVTWIDVQACPVAILRVRGSRGLRSGAWIGFGDDAAAVPVAGLRRDLAIAAVEAELVSQGFVLRLGGAS